MKDHEINEKSQENKVVYLPNSRKYNKLFFLTSLFNFIAIIFTIIFLIVFYEQPNSFQGNNINESANDYCQNKESEYYDFLCTNKYYKYNIKKSKFIWVITDGTAADQVILLRDYEKYKIGSSFLVEGDDITYKHTNEIHEALITGKHNRNYKGKEINYDNIIQQLVNAGYKINYRGWGLPIPDIVGDKKNGIKENKIFYKKYIDDDHEVTAFSSFCNITNPFPFIKFNFDKYQNPTPNNVVDDELLNKIKDIVNKKESHLYDKDSKLELYEELDELFKTYPIDLFSVNISECLKKSFDWNENENISILYYSTEVDHYNHLMGKNHINNVLQMYITEKMMEKIIEWIDDHDDYVLIVTDDHGGQEFFGEDALRNHGEDNPGNEAIFMVYSKDLKDHYEELKMRERYIHINDESDIIPQILMDINIPINSRGFPMKLIKDDINEFISLKMKEIQLIKLMEKYIEKYSNYEKDLKGILNELKNNFSSTDSIINEYITENKEINSNKTLEFKNLLKSYKVELINKQNIIIEILKKRNKTAGNITLFIFIFLFIVIKSIIEIYFLFFKLIDKEKAELNNSRNKRWYIMNIFVYLFFYILLFYGSIVGDNLRGGIIIYCFFYGYYLTIVNFHYFINVLYLIWKNNKLQIIIYITSIFCFTVFCQFMSYSDGFYYLKRNFTYYSKIDVVIINFFSFVVFLLFLIMRELFKNPKGKYFFSFFKKRFNMNLIYIFFFLFLITLFIEDCTKKDYFEQNNANKVFVCINFIFILILGILSHWAVHEEKTSNEVRDVFIEINNDSVNEKVNILKTRRVEGLPSIKLFLTFIFYWLTDESQRAFGLIILFPFLEVLDYLSNDFYEKMNKDEKENKDSDDLKSLDSSNKSLKNENNNKNKRNNNFYIYYFLFYIIIQDMFLLANQSTFALLKNSFGLESNNYQGAKSIYVLKKLKGILSVGSLYVYNIIVLGFFLEKGIYDKEYSGKYSWQFLVRKIMLGLRINMDIIYFFYQMLINVNDRLFADLFIYSFVNIGLYLLDFIGFGFTKLGILLSR